MRRPGCFNIGKTFDVYSPGMPLPGGAPVNLCAGDNTYLYTLTHVGGTLASPGIPITQFELLMDVSVVTGAGSIPCGGIAPLGRS